LVGARRDVQLWIKRFQRLAKEMPADVWVFVASGTPTVLATDENGHHIDRGRNNGVDQDAIIDTAIGGNWDGGDW
jgi:predicted aspartyl protease